MSTYELMNIRIDNLKSGKEKSFNQKRLENITLTDNVSTHFRAMEVIAAEFTTLSL